MAMQSNAFGVVKCASDQ